MMGMVYGLANNDAPYVTNVEKRIDGKRVIVWRCPFYTVWRNMIYRCYSSAEKTRRPRYAGCTVCDEWLTFSNFKAWMERQDWEGKHLDKDIISFGNKLYSPEYCVFIPQALNAFLTKVADISIGKTVGACWHSGINKYVAYCCNSVNGDRECLGCFESAIKAHDAWVKRKAEICLMLSKVKDYANVSEALVRLSSVLLNMGITREVTP